MPPPALVVRTLADGGQKHMDIAEVVAAFIGASRQTLDLALYDVRLPSPTGDVVAGAIRAAAPPGGARGGAFNPGHPRPLPPPPAPPRACPRPPCCPRRACRSVRSPACLT